MDYTDDTGEPTAETTARATMQSSVSKETPITIPPTITYGMQETHTTICPYLAYLSAPGLDRSVPRTISLRLNAPLDMIVDTDLSTTTTYTQGQFWTYKTSDENVNAGANTIVTQFPNTIGQNLQLERPWWFIHWQQYYRYYTVLSCDYEITLDNPRGHGLDVLVGENIETYGTTGNVETPKNSPLDYLMATKSINWHKVAARPESHTQIIKGTYKPGTAYRDILNDGDVKLWTDVVNVPALKECLRIWLFRHPLSSVQNDINLNAELLPAATNTLINKATINDNNYQTHINMQIRLKYIVQFKGLVTAAQYPNAQTQTITSMPTSFLPTL